MDETTQITLTIWGMIAAFLTASVTPILTEAVKNWLQHKTKLNKLRTALYKELASDYLALKNLGEQEVGIHGLAIFVELGIRTESYKSITQNQLIEFYELRESTAFNTLYRLLDVLIRMPTRKLSMDGHELDADQSVAYFHSIRKIFEETLIMNIDNGKLDDGILRNFMEENLYVELIKNTKEWGKKHGKKKSRR